MPVKFLKDNKDFFAGYFQIIFNDAITKSKFPSSLKMTKMKVVFKKGTKSIKENYRPISFYLWFRRFLKELFASN